MQRGVIPRAVEDVLNIIKADLSASVIENTTLEGIVSPALTPIMSARKLSAREQVITQVHTKGAADPDMINERVYLKMSVYMIYCDRIFDLLGQSQHKVRLEQYIDRQSQQVVSRFVNISEKLILNLEQYYSAMQQAFKERKSISVKLQDHEIRKRSHLIVSLSLV